MPTASGSQRLARHISVTPDVIQFENINPGGDVYSATARINNLDQTGPRSVRIKAPTTKWFSIKGVNHTERIAPGLSVSFEVFFDPKLVTAADTNRDGFHDCIKITSEKQDVELWVHAMLPRPQLQLQGDLQFGMVGVDSKPSKQLQLTCTGQMPADYKLDWEKSLPLTIEPQSGTAQPGSTTLISAKLAAAEVGAITGELLVTIAGRPEPYRQSISATVVQQSYELTDTSNAAISELNFGSMFHGEAVTRTITIVNSGPAEARFDLSYGSKADMAAIAATEGGTSTGDDQHSAFLRMARIRAKLREDKELVVRVSPIAGTIAPYSTAQLTVTFRPPASAQAKGFKAQPLSAPQQAQLFEYLLQVGGLGDVVHGLARTCLARGHNVTVIMPFYECLPQDQIEGLGFDMDIDVPKGYTWDGAFQIGALKTAVFRGVIGGVPVILIRPADWNSCNLFRGGRIYGGSYNEMESYLYFCRAALEYLKASGQQPHIMHLHEWQTAAAAMLYWEVYSQLGLYRPRVVLTVHNLDNTGECRQDEFAFSGVAGEVFATIDRALDERTIGHNPERLNLMKGGMVYSNAVTTVSPTYANEVLNGGQAGWLRSTLGRPEVKSKVRGILNGIDVVEWDPARDTLLAANFNAQFPDGKAVCKKYLQKGLGLDENADKPIIAVITRLVPQKGIHLIKAALFRCLEKGAQFVLLGSGHCDGEFRRMAEQQFKDHKDIRLCVMYSEALAHQIYAAADIILVPSMFEPCGLTQMIGMRYGAVPVVRKTGGLADTVRDVETHPRGEGNGYTFDGADEGSLFAALDRSLTHFKEQRKSWGELSQTNMNTELSWSRSAADYVALYNSIAMP